MTDLDAAVDTFGLNRFVPGLAQTEIRHLVDDDRGIPDRSVVWVEFDDDDEPARLDAATGFQLERGIAAALDQRIPVVLVICTSGTDIEQGMAALDGWGRVASRLTACSGVDPDDRDRRRAGGVRTRAAPRCRRLHDHDRAFVCLRQRSGDGRGVHRESRSDADELGGSASHARYTGVATFVVPDRAAAADAVDRPARLPPRQRRCRAGHAGRRSTPVTDCAPRPARRSRRRRPAATTSARLRRRSPTRTRCSRSVTAGPPTW